jgi:hypothetical protein
MTEAYLAGRENVRGVPTRKNDHRIESPHCSRCSTIFEYAGDTMKLSDELHIRWSLSLL